MAKHQNAILYIALLSLVTAQSAVEARGVARAGVRASGVHHGGYAIGTSSSRGTPAASSAVHHGGYAIGTGTSSGTPAAAPAVHTGGYAIGTGTGSSIKPTYHPGTGGRAARRGLGGYGYGYPLTGAGQVPTDTTSTQGWDTSVDEGDVALKSHRNRNHSDAPAMSFGSHSNKVSDPAARLPAMHGAPLHPDSVGSDISGRLDSVQHTLENYRTVGKLGTFDDESLTNRLKALQDEAARIDELPPDARTAAASSLMSAAGKLESDIQRHQ